MCTNPTVPEIKGGAASTFPNGTDLDLTGHGADFRAALNRLSRRVIICAGTGCLANGSLKVHDAFIKELSAAGLHVQVSLKTEDDSQTENPATCGSQADDRACTAHDRQKESRGEALVSGSGCQGFCQMGPLVTILPDNILYCKVRPEDVPEVVEATIKGGTVVDRLLYSVPGNHTHCRNTDEIPFYTGQIRKVLGKCGTIDPEDIREYVATGGYDAARKAFTEMTPEEVCREMTQAGLRGRGGGGFPTGRKWDLTRVQPDPVKYVICNGDEGDPGAFMDRSIMEGNPHVVIEGMLVAARAIGASEGFIYVRAEYPLAVDRLILAVSHALEHNILGDNIFGTEHSFTINVIEGAGAFVCGEETALIASIEGDRGMPKPKPPFPAQSGLWGHPTVINNVETLATIPSIIVEGATEFRKLGTAQSPGTKTFALTGHVANTGLIEVPFGTTLRTIIYEIGGGVTDSKGRITEEGFKAVQIGGPSGGCLTQEHLDLPLDYESLQKIGAMVGSGGLVVMNQSTCMVKVARFFMQFTQNESCGKCVPCREGTRQMLALLDDIIEGRGTAETLHLLDLLSRTVKKASLCGLGKTAPNPIQSTLNYFREELEAHVFHKTCPAGECKALLKPTVIADLCKGCTVCARKCPVNAISGERKQPHFIDHSQCISCMACVEACKFNAITLGGAV